MKQITVISGKGGTGKTTITAALAKVAQNYVVADCDVDAADLHLVLKPKIEKKFNFYAGKRFMVDKNICISCGKCKELCRYDAIDESFTIDSVSCEGCGACYFECPVKAIAISDNLAGEYYLSTINDGKTPFVHANLHIGEDNSGKLVAQVRKESRNAAAAIQADYILIDGPPGIGCPVNAAIVGVDLTLLVTEPTMSGIHDLERILKVTKHFNIESKVVVNKYDINKENTKKIENICTENKSSCIAKIPYDKAVVEALIAGQSILDTNPDHIISKEVKKIWQSIG